MLPSLADLEKISQQIKRVPNRRKESKRQIHYGCYLLCSKSGLRISEAIKFDLSTRTKKGLYRIAKPKGKKERFVYIPKKVIGELEKNNWKPNQTNRHNFYHFLRKIKKGLNISKEIELTPHTLRHAFATYQAESGMPLPILQKQLGHSSIRTTALYWRNIYQEPDNEIGPILAAKNWLERPRPSQNQRPAKPLTTENFPEISKIPKTIILLDKPKLAERPIIKEIPLPFIKQKPIIKPKPHGQEILAKFTDYQSINSPLLALTTNQESKPTKKEAILLQKIKHLEQQLTQIQRENNNLRLENNHLKSLIQQEQENETKIIQTLPS